MPKRAVAVAPQLNSTTNADAYRRFLRPDRTARSETEAIQWMIERKLMELSMNRFQWEGMEELGVNIRWMEMSLNFMALSVFHRADETEDDTAAFGERYEALRAGAGTGLTRTGDPTSFWIYGMDGSNKEIKAAECVPIWSNFMRIPDWDIITIYARRLAEIDRTLDINALQMRHPKVLKTTSNTSLSIQSLRKQLDEGASAIEIDTSSLDPSDAVGVLDMGLDKDQLINLHIFRTREWAECMTLLGINNSNQDKKERLTAAETAGNDDVIATIRETNLKARRIACKQIKDKYGVEVSVDYTTDMKTAVTKDVGAADSEGKTVADPNAEKVGA